MREAGLTAADNLHVMMTFEKQELRDFPGLSGNRRTKGVADAPCSVSKKRFSIAVWVQSVHGYTFQIDDGAPIVFFGVKLVSQSKEASYVEFR